MNKLLGLFLALAGIAAHAYTDTEKKALLNRNMGATANKVSLGDIVFGSGVTTQYLAGTRGTAALPTYSFSSDPDTGIWSVSANVVAISTNGVERWRIGSTGSLLNTPNSVNGFVGISSANGSDSKALLLYAGSGDGVARSAGVEIYGNQHSGAAGDLALVAGTTAEAADAEIQFFTGVGTEQINIDGNGDMIFLNAGDGIKLKKGSNAAMGVATLVAGVASVPTTAVTLGDHIMLSVATASASLVGASSAVHYLQSVTTGVGFGIQSTHSGDTSSVNWLIIKASP